MNETEYINLTETKRLLNSLKCHVTYISSDYKIIWANQAALNFMGLTLEEAVGENCCNIYYSIYNACQDCLVKEAIESKEVNNEEVKDIEGKTWNIEWHPVQNEKEFPAVVMVAYNITKPRRIENMLREDRENLYRVRNQFERSKERFESLFLHNPDSIFAIELDGRIISANPATEDVFGYHPDELVGTYYNNYILEKDKEKTKYYFFKTVEGKPQEFNCAVEHKDGDSVDIKIKSFPMIIDDEIVAVYAIAKDISEKKEIERKLKDMAYQDSLTKLPNRYYIEEELEKLIKRKKNTAVLFLDLDRFNRINDSLGHNIGDIVLKKTAMRLNKIIGPEHVVGRFSGDEFIILLEDINDKEEVIEIIERLDNSFSEPFQVSGNSIFVSFSTGVSIFPDDETEKELLIKNADIAMYKAKNTNNSYLFYDDKLLRQKSLSTRKLNMESEMRKAIQNEDFILYYQPQVDIYNGEIVGLEALIRWQHERLGVISPGDFIPLAEETGLIREIGRWVLKEACSQFVKWKEMGYKPGKIAVNVSVNQLEDDQFVEVIRNILEETGIHPGSLEIELTENIMRNINQLESKLENIRDLGIMISIDDFGTGYSSLSILEGLPISTLKIDRSFISKSTKNVRSAALVKTIIDMGHNLDLNIIAEGIEEKEEVNLLRENNCRQGQGYLFSRPLPEIEVVDVFDFNIAGLTIT